MPLQATIDPYSHMTRSDLERAARSTARVNRELLDENERLRERIEEQHEEITTTRLYVWQRLPWMGYVS